MDPLASLDDVEERLARALTVDESVRVLALLTDASAAVRAYTGQTFTEDDSTTRITVKGPRIRLPQRPVTAVDSVQDTNGNDVAFTWLGGDVVELASNVPDSWSFEPWRNGIRAVDVTYTHGGDVPDVVRAVVCSIVIRSLGVQPEYAGYTNRSLGDASVGASLGTVGAAGVVGLFDDERRQLDPYRRQMGMMRVGPP